MIRILLVEDDADQIELYSDALDEVNEEGNQLELIICKTLPEGMTAVKTDTYDAAIVDLRLSAADMVASGNKIVHAIVHEARYPIYVVSGNIQDLDPEITKHKLVTAKNRDFKKNDIFYDILKSYNVGITELLGNNGKIEDWINKIFWEHVVSSLEYWKESQSDKVVKKKSLLRYCILHLIEYLNQDDEGVDEVYDPAETYIMPPIKSTVSAGDIIKAKSSNQYYLLLTPPCDTVCRTPGDPKSRRARKFLLAQMTAITSLADVAGKEKSSKGRFESIVGYCKNSKRIEFHFLPGFMSIPASVVDFQSLSTVDCATFDAEFDRICTVSQPFYKDITSRFSSYYARQGQPDFDFDSVAAKINTL